MKLPWCPVAPAHGVVGEVGVVGHENLWLHHDRVVPPDSLVPVGFVDSIQYVAIKSVSVGNHDLIHQLLIVRHTNVPSALVPRVVWQ